MDFAFVIKDSITMEDVLRMYGFPDPPKKRIPCPIHNGKDNNFSYNDEFFHCFSCGASGDVIGFVEQYFGLTFKEAIEKINIDFNLRLPIGKQMTLRQRRSIEGKYKEKKAAADAERKMHESLKQKYSDALDEYVRLDRQRIKYAPKSVDEPLHPLFEEALLKIAKAEYDMDNAEMRLREYENRR